MKKSMQKILKTIKSLGNKEQENSMKENSVHNGCTCIIFYQKWWIYNWCNIYVYSMAVLVLGGFIIGAIFMTQ
jgi:putative methionine-R-sulfoxide reductase with GAF domain